MIHPKSVNEILWFVLGRETLIAAAEIAAKLEIDTSHLDITPPIMRTRAHITDATDLIATLGGTIKIAHEICHLVSETEIIQQMVALLNSADRKIHFGVSIYDDTASRDELLSLAKKIGLTVKKELLQNGRSVRYASNRDPALSSVTVTVNNLILKGAEFLITRSGTQFSAAATLAVQPYADLSERDFGRPGRDDASGMLPPKLALIMLNLANVPKNTTILDPFCGSGTIITEAMLANYTKIIGSDISEKAVSDTEDNVSWIQQKYTEKNLPTPRIAVADARLLSKTIAHHSVDAIVAEPFLGKPLNGREPRHILEQQQRFCTELIVASLADWKKIMTKNGIVVLSLPRYRYQNGWLPMDWSVVIKKAGYSIRPLLTTHHSLVYARPNQHVGRELWKFSLAP